MSKILLSIICFIFIHSGCKSFKSEQPENINRIISINNTPQKQFLDYFESIEKKGELAVINPYRQAVLATITNYDSDTIIYYESMSRPSMTIGIVNYYCNIYESQNKRYHSYKKNEISTATNVPVSKNSLSQTNNIHSIKLENISTNDYFRKIVEFVKENNLKAKLLTGKSPQWVGSISYGNTLVIATKTGGLFRFESYKDISFKPKGIIQVEPLQVDTIR